MNATQIATQAGEYAMEQLMYTKSNSKLPSRQECSSSSSFASTVKQLHSSNIQLKQRIGRGSYGSVYRAKVVACHDTILNTETMKHHHDHPHHRNYIDNTQEEERYGNNNDDDHYYAIKILDPTIRYNSSCSSYYHEAAFDLVLESYILSHLNHENIIQLYGIPSGSISKSFVNHPTIGYFLVLDLLQNETLYDRLSQWRRRMTTKTTKTTRTTRTTTTQKPQQVTEATTSHHLIRCSRHHHRHRPSSSDKKELLSLMDRVETVALSIVKAMEYLHQNNIVFRDLKPDNVGFAIDGTLKLFDFGFAREVHHLLDRQRDNDNKLEVAGTLHYMAPEYLVGGDDDDGPPHPTSSSSSSSGLLSTDVYSFGVVLWEICTLQKPYGQFRSKEKYIEMVISSKRKRRKWQPSLRSIPSPIIRKIISECWDENPLKRPTFTQIRNDLEHLILYNKSGTTTTTTTTTSPNDGDHLYSLKHTLRFIPRSKQLFRSLLIHTRRHKGGLQHGCMAVTSNVSRCTDATSNTDEEREEKETSLKCKGGRV